MTELLGLVIAMVLLWVRRFRARRGWVRVLLMIAAALFAYPAVNASYIALKRFLIQLLAVHHPDLMTGV